MSILMSNVCIYPYIYIIRAYTVCLVESGGSFPVIAAIQSGSIEVLDWLYHHGVDASDLTRECT